MNVKTFPSADDHIREIIRKMLSEATYQHFFMVVQFEVPEHLCEELRDKGYVVKHKVKTPVQLRSEPKRPSLRVTEISWAPYPFIFPQRETEDPEEPS